MCDVCLIELSRKSDQALLKCLNANRFTYGLLEKILNKIPGTIQPLKNKKLIIRTDSPESYTHMLRRSCRWVCKMSQSNLKKTKAIGLMVLLCNLSLILILQRKLKNKKLQVRILIIY